MSIVNTFLQSGFHRIDWSFTKDHRKDDQAETSLIIRRFENRTSQ